jgi:hypothetical protein
MNEFMKRKRMKTQLKHIRRRGGKIPGTSHKAMPPFENPRLWLNLLTIDFSLFCGRETDNNGEQIPAKENT